jgi:hypothetical protein
MPAARHAPQILALVISDAPINFPSHDAKKKWLNARRESGFSLFLNMNAVVKTIKKPTQRQNTALVKKIEKLTAQIQVLQDKLKESQEVAVDAAV